jgi:hypothetical protein
MGTPCSTGGQLPVQQMLTPVEQAQAGCGVVNQGLRSAKCAEQSGCETQGSILTSYYARVRCGGKEILLALGGGVGE